MNGINIDNLISAASKKLGLTPAELKKALGSGDLSAVTANLSPADRARIDAVMKNPEMTRQLRERYMGGKRQ